MINMCNINDYIHMVCLLSICAPVTVSLRDDVDDYRIEYPVPRVINGTKATEAQFPYQVALKVAAKGDAYDATKAIFDTFCAGSIIREDRVLTAAHCIATDGNWCDRVFLQKSKVVRTKGMYAVAGSLLSNNYYDKDNTTQWRRITKGLILKDFKFPHTDIAVVSISEPFSYNKYVNALPFATVHKDYNASNNCVASGYGLTVTDAKDTSYSLLWANIDLVSVKDCAKRFQGVMKTQAHICMDEKYSSIYNGDSGGPLVCFNTGDPAEKDHGVIVGVVCGSTTCSSKRECGTIFTRVSSYKQFLDSATKSKEIILYHYCLLIIFYLYQNLISI